MEIPTAKSVEARFDGRTLRDFERTWRFERSGSKFFVELEEPGRELRRWPIAYTFGVYPLQQYLVAFPDGRFQALPVAWDARPVEKGGERWFSLQPGESVPADDPLHWEGLAYNWNSQCALCHSTHLEKRYDEKFDRFDTRSTELDVACEACHGPGSRHVEWMNEGRPRAAQGLGLEVNLDIWQSDRWQYRGDSAIASPTTKRQHDNEIDVCAPCHSRRSPIGEMPRVGAPFLDGYRPAWIDADLYFDDGQIRDEVYVWGSFLQSRMYAAGVRCSDCHDPHSLKLRREGNRLCQGCHAVNRYATRAHHGHEPEGKGGDCIACHMPERTYMGVDRRRDHAFVVPRPQRSRSLGSPFVCESCHPKRDAVWASRQIAGWRGGKDGPENWADRLVDEEGARKDVGRWREIALDPVAPPIVRASAWSRFAAGSNSVPSAEELDRLLREGSDLERLALVEVIRRLPPRHRMSLLSPLLTDDRRAIRIAAAEALSDLPASIGRPSFRSRLARALREYRDAQDANAERPEAQVNLGVLAIREGNPDAARAAYEKALDRAGYFVPAYVNLSDLERVLGNQEASIERLQRAMMWAPGDARVRHALGLALHRAGRTDEALEELGRAARADPGQARLILAWALSLDAAGRRSEAIQALSDWRARGAEDRQVDQAIVSLLRKDRQFERANAIVRRREAAESR